MANAIKELSTSPVLFIINPALWLSVAVTDIVLQGLKPKTKVPQQADLQDRSITTVASEAPHLYVCGRARVGSRVVAVLTSGSRDEYKHIVSVHASHECDAYEEIYIDGKALGTLDANGGVTSGDFFTRTPTETSQTFTGTGVTLTYTPVTGTVRLLYQTTDEDGYTKFVEELTYTLVGSIISGATSRIYTVNYSYNVDKSFVRVKKYLGASTDVADAATIAEVPTKWTINHKLSGHAYTIIRLDLNFKDFQNGLPSIQVLLRGKKLNDVRSASYPNDTKVWSQNPALILADYLTSEICGVPRADLPLADFIAAANVCDEIKTFGKLYEANGTVSADESQRGVIEKIAQSMAATIEPNTWGVIAGKYIGTVMALTQADIVGDLSYSAGTPESELFNGVKGQYISSANNYVATDFQPYQNAAYVTADGSELWSDMDFSFTSDKQRVHNLARIFTEDQRNGFSLKADFSYKTWALKVGQRVTFSSAFMGQTNKVYRVLSKNYGIGSAVTLTLKEDASSIWDMADAVTSDSTPNTGLPNPFFVPVPSNILVAEALYETTGSSGVKVKATVSWTAPADINVLDYSVEYKRYEDPYYLTALFSSGTQIEIFDITSGRYDFRVSARNHLNLRSAWSVVKTATIYGLTLIPGNVTGFTVKPFNGSAICTWSRTIDLDVKIGGDVEIRFCPLTTGQSWEQSYVIPDGQFNGDATSAIVSLATGTYYAKFIDSTGQYSAIEASFIVTEALITGWTTVTTTTQDPTFTGSKTSVFVDNNALKLGGTTLWDAMPLMDTWGQIDYMGGVSATGTYLFGATVDLTTVASRRFHVVMQALSVSVSDTIDARLTNIDTWESVDGAVINGTDATVYASVSDDNITFSAWAPFMVADFRCRYAKFKAVLTSNNTNQNIEVSQLRVAIKIPV